jgi:hypothetical protein
MITSFSDFQMPDVNSVSREFWKMTTVVNWKKVIVDYKNADKFSSSNREVNENRKKIKELAQKRLCLKYEYEQIKNFEKELQYMYKQLYLYFKKSWLDGKIDVSDDGYWDLLTSVIGSGKKFTKECLWNPKILSDMAKKNNYVENFSYLFTIDEKEYIEIKSKYDPLFRDVKKYNI